jgi:transposase-like protein
MRTKRTWTAAEKLAILKEAELQGITVTIRKHGIYAQTLYGWKQKYELEGSDGLNHPWKRVNPELKRLQVENQRLKQIVAEKELVIQIKDDLLKKTTARTRKDA